MVVALILLIGSLSHTLEDHEPCLEFQVKEEARLDGQEMCLLAWAGRDGGHVYRSLAGNGGVRTKMESTMMTILEVFETSYYPSTNFVVGKVARQVAKRRYKS